MRILFYLFTLLGLSSTSNVFSQPSEEEIKKASCFFEEFNIRCSNENGRLWGESLCVPIVLIDRENRFIFSQEPININSKQNYKDNVYYYIAPNEMLLSSGVLNIDNKNYASVNFTYYSVTEVIEIIFHEITHKIQNDNNYSPSYNNPHIETKFGQLYIRLESMALINALSEKGDKRREYVKDALYFRNKRQTMFKDAKENETKFELQEGLAEYTGIFLTYSDTAINVFIDKIRKNLEGRIGVRIFGYNTGAAYSFLNQDSLNWNSNIYSVGDISNVTRKIYDIDDEELSSINEKKLFSKYKFDDLLQKEDSIEKAISERDRLLINKFGKEKLLKIQLDEKAIFAFNPNNTVNINGGITYYDFLELKSFWGRIYSKNGCFMKGDSIYFVLPEGLIIDQLNEKSNNEKIIFNLSSNCKITKGERFYCIECK